MTEALPLIGLAFLLGCWTLPWAAKPFTPHEAAFWQVVGSGAALVAVAYQIPNGWVSLAFVGIALAPSISMILATRGWVLPVENFGAQSTTQLLVLIGAVVYLSLTRWWTPDRFWWWLVIVTVWATINAVLALFQHVGYTLPGWTVMPTLRTVGFTQTPPFLACLLWVAFAAAPALFAWWWVPLVPLWAFAYRCIPSGQYAAGWAATLAGSVALALWATPVAWALVPLVIALPLTAKYRNLSSVTCRRAAVWNQFRRLGETKYLGCGLGCLPVIRTNPNHPEHLMWASSHNDWLHLWLEGGPLPVIGLAGGLVTALMGVAGLLDPIALAAGLQLLFFACYGLVYFPGRVPFQILLWVAPLSYLCR